MITLVGTSHISPESVAEIPGLIEKYSPDVVAVELDPYRFQALKTEKRGRRVGNPFLTAVQYIQQHLGKKTGISPGDEFMHAADIAEQHGIPVALIDQPITVTSQRLMDIPLLEKIKIAGFMLLGFASFGGEIDLEKVPSQAFIQKMLAHIRVSFPRLYQALIEERDEFMAEQLRQLEEEFGDVLAFVGAGHLNGLEQRLT